MRKYLLTIFMIAFPLTANAALLEVSFQNDITFNETWASMSIDSGTTGVNLDYPLQILSLPKFEQSAERWLHRVEISYVGSVTREGSSSGDVFLVETFLKSPLYYLNNGGYSTFQDCDPFCYRLITSSSHAITFSSSPYFDDVLTWVPYDELNIRRDDFDFFVADTSDDTFDVSIDIDTQVGVICGNDTPCGYSETITGTSTVTVRYFYSDIQPVPIPSAVWLFGSGLIGLVGLARRKL